MRLSPTCSLECDANTRNLMDLDGFRLTRCASATILQTRRWPANWNGDRRFGMRRNSETYNEQGQRQDAAGGLSD